MRHPRYGIPSAARMAHRIRPDLIEFPPSTWRLCGANIPVAGGAYLRILPYGFLRAAAKKLNRRGIVLNNYFHVWEIDFLQPKLKLPLGRFFLHYYGLKSAQGKFKSLLEEFQFAPVSQVIQNERF